MSTYYIFCYDLQYPIISVALSSFSELLLDHPFLLSNPEFIIEYEENQWEPGRWKELVRVPGNHHSALLKLHGHADYSFRVSAVNEVGRGQPSRASDRYKTPASGLYYLLRFSLSLSIINSSTATRPNVLLSHIQTHCFKMHEIFKYSEQWVNWFPLFVKPMLPSTWISQAIVLFLFLLFLIFFPFSPSLALFCTTNFTADKIHISAPSKAPDKNPENIKIEAHLPHEMDINWKVGGHVFCYEILSRAAKFQSAELQFYSLRVEDENKKMLSVFWLLLVLFQEKRFA